jgi:hypothetical protein
VVDVIRTVEWPFTIEAVKSAITFAKLRPYAATFGLGEHRGAPHFCSFDRSVRIFPIMYAHISSDARATRITVRPIRLMTKKLLGEGIVLTAFSASAHRLCLSHLVQQEIAKRNLRSRRASSNEGTVPVHVLALSLPSPHRQLRANIQRTRIAFHVPSM